MASFTAAKNGRSGPSWNKKNTSTRRSKTEALCLYQQSSFALHAFFFRAGEHGSINCQIFTLIHIQVSLLVEPAALLPTSGSAALPALHDQLLHTPRAAAIFGTAYSSSPSWFTKTSQWLPRILQQPPAPAMTRLRCGDEKCQVTKRPTAASSTR
jgi:hypothetical protein